MHRSFKLIRRLFLVLGIFSVTTAAGVAAVKLPAIFGDHMVLQQDGKIPVWGTADPGENVKVTIGASQAEGQADANGKWRVDLPPLATNATGQTLTVTGKNTLTFQDVLIGDVWLASGQSNMEFQLREALNAQQAIPQATNPELRLFVVAHQPGIEPKTDIQGSWMVCTPQTATTFSAVAYFFGQNLQQALHRPIGLVGSYWGGTHIETWISFDKLQTVPSAAPTLANVQKQRDAFPKDPAGQAAVMADFNARLLNWRTKIIPDYVAAVKKWQADDAAAKTAGKPEPPHPILSENQPQSPDGEGGEATALFNGMIAPLIPFAMKGVIWYQGESNSENGGGVYSVLLQDLISDWRSRWNEGDFPFLIVQLANFDPGQIDPVDSGAARVREAQFQTVQKDPHTGLAVTLDLGNGNIHPPDKFDMGNRLAATALHVAYGQDVPYAGPSFAGMSFEGAKVRIKFKDVGTGLVVETPPVISNPAPPPPPTHLVGFAIAGADRKWFWADATIDGNQVIVSSPAVSAPVAVRYGWANTILVNLANKEGFPAAPFRTDDWPYVQPPPPPPKK
jgi:sialate O-acetylesterase